MCKIGIMLGTAGENLPSAILFMNSNQCDKRLQEIARDRKFYNKCMRNEIKVSHALILF